MLLYIGTEQDYQQFKKLKLNQQFEAKEGEVSRENLEAQQMEEMDMQAEALQSLRHGPRRPDGPRDVLVTPGAVAICLSPTTNT